MHTRARLKTINNMDEISVREVVQRLKVRRESWPDALWQHCPECRWLKRYTECHRCNGTGIVPVMTVQTKDIYL